MERRGMDRLNSFLFEGEEELVNVKYFPASSQNLTRERFADAVADMIKFRLISFPFVNRGNLSISSRIHVSGKIIGTFFLLFCQYHFESLHNAFSILLMRSQN